MSLKHAILGFLNNSPKTGYDLQKKIEITIQHFWPSTQSQIYRTLKELETDALIRSEIVYQSDKPNRVVYSITQSGGDELTRWLSAPLQAAPHRDPLLVQLFFSRNVSTDVIIANLLEHRKTLEEKLSFLKGDEARTRVGLGVGNKEEALFRIIVDNGIRLLESEINWVDDAVKKLRAITD